MKVLMQVLGILKVARDRDVRYIIIYMLRSILALPYYAFILYIS